MRQLQAEMDAAEFAEWIEYYKIEPFGDDWLQASTVAAAGVNLWSKRKVKPDAFVPRAKLRKTPQEMEAVMMAWAKARQASTN